MLRQLLTLLAVLTGLTATVTPAHALDTGVQAVEVAHDVASCHTTVEAAQLGWSETQIIVSEVRGCLRPGPVLAFVAPSVYLQADRARE